MLIETKSLGPVEIKEEEILLFENGLPGFPQYKKFVLLPLDVDMPLAMLQSVEEESIGFVMAFPYAFKPDYMFDLSDEDVTELQIEKPEDVITYTIVTLKDTFETSTLNLLAPVIINTTKKLGKQIVLQDSKQYALRFPISEGIGSGK
jgi:flagellar assembly factor FliW